MKVLHSLITLGLLLLVLAGVVGLVLTRDTGRPTSSGQTLGQGAPPVDEHPLQTARDMAKLASSWDEERLAEQAHKVADHEVDLAFADALRDASEQPRATTAQSRELYARVNKAESLVQGDQSRIDDLKKKLAASTDDRQKTTLQQQLDLVTAQLELDQDELDDAKEDLSRSGLDPLSRVQLQFNNHEAAMQVEDAHPQSSPPNVAPEAADGSLLIQIAAWRAAHNKITQLQQAQAEAMRNAALLSQKHDELEKQISAEQSDQQSLTQQASSQLSADQSQGSTGVSGETAAAIQSLHTVSVDQKDVSDLDKRIQDHTELRDAYGNWVVLVKSDQRVALHGILKSTLYIVVIVLAIFLAGRLVEHFLSDLNPEHTRFRTLRIITRFALRALGLVLILLVVFGVPKQITTVLGLAGAGLTVALQDFIISFLGWFALMGRNGMSVGDWVEINGVAGEVMEIGLLRTVLLETGNWAEPGHPTGRKVAMMNSFAIQGHFFNFSTSGQWLWDEVQVTVPTGDDPYPVIEAIQQMVVKETAADTQAAEQEWKRATNRYRVQAVSAEPAVNLRPTGAGVEVHVRYITRANERYATRTRLYQAVVELLHKRGVKAETAQTVPAVPVKAVTK